VPEQSSSSGSLAFAEKPGKRVQFYRTLHAHSLVQRGERKRDTGVGDREQPYPQFVLKTEKRKKRNEKVGAGWRHPNKQDQLRVSAACGIRIVDQLI